MDKRKKVKERRRRPKPIYFPTPGKKITMIAVIALAVIIIGAVVVYYYVYPRVDLEIKTLYHERIGGGSTGGGINVNVLFSNKGTEDIEGLSLVLTVINQTDQLMKQDSMSVGDIEPHEASEAYVDFIGNHLDTYYITLSVKFSSGGESYSKDYSYKTYEDAMNIVFLSEVSG